MVAFDDGSIWELDTDDTDNQTILGLAFMRDFAGAEVNASKVSALDHAAIGKTDYVLFGDILGTLSILKDKRPVFFDRHFSSY